MPPKRKARAKSVPPRNKPRWRLNRAINGEPWPWWRTVDDLDVLARFYEVSRRTLQRWRERGCVINDIRDVCEFLAEANRRSRGERQRCMNRGRLALNVCAFLAARAGERLPWRV